MFTVHEVSEKLSVSKVTVYSKLKKFNNMVVVRQGQKYITEELFELIKEDLIKVKNNLNMDSDENNQSDEIATDTAELINLNKDLINTLIKQLEEKDRQIEQLHKLLENSQVLLKNEKEIDKLKPEEHLEDITIELKNVNEKRTHRKSHEKRGFFKRLFK
jgi:acetyl-CoA carboxylase alpha subunit